MLRFGGVPFEVEPRSALAAAEREWLARIESESALETPDDDACQEMAPFRLQIVEAPSWPRTPGATASRGEPADFHYDGNRVRLDRDDFAAEIDPVARQGRLYRTGSSSGALQVALKVAMACELPLRGGMVLHSAGLVRGSEGLLFFGPSGAGKSTISGLSPYPVVSDELVAVAPGPPFTLRSSGFWGTLDRAEAPRGAFRLRAAFALEKGSRFHAERLTPASALRRLLGVTLVPSSPPLWNAVLSSLGHLVKAIPVFRLAWSPDAPPWKEIERLLSEELE